jgi:hypothetical protein
MGRTSFALKGGGVTAQCLIAFLVLLANPARAELSKRQLAKLQQSLKEAAQKFGDAYVNRDFKTMYKMLNPEYRHRVELWEYKDYVHYDGVSDGYMKVEVMEAIILPGGKYGKVIKKISTVENIKGKTTGKVTKREEEFMEEEDWVNKNGTWYKIQKLD